MVFMTPISNYKIIGAKLLSILLTGATLVAFLGLLPFIFLFWSTVEDSDTARYAMVIIV